MSQNGGARNPPPRADAEVEGDDLEPVDDDEEGDEDEVMYELRGNFVDGFEIANAFRVEAYVDDDEDDDEEEADGEDNDSGRDQPDGHRRYETSAEAGAGGDGGDLSDNIGQGGSSGARRSFDKGLPSKHLYLGENVEEVRGHRSMPDDYEEIEIPLFPERKVALVPGQVIPLTVFDPVYVSLFNNLVRDCKDFGIRFSESTPYGTLAEIFEYCPEPAYHAGMSVKARGRHRFKVLSTRTTTNGVRFAKVRIQPEVVLPAPMHTVRFQSLDRRRLQPTDEPPSPRAGTDDEEASSSTTSMENVQDSARRRLSRKRKAVTDRIEMACSPWPGWVFNMYDETDLARRVRESVPGTSYVAQNRKKFLQSSDNMPTDPVGLSHWVARSLPFPESDRIVLLQFNSAVQRLRYELSLTAIDKFRTLGCAVCGREIATQGDVLAMSEDGPQGVFVNMGGYIHDILTFSKLSNRMRLRGDKETEYSWFPGYAWRIGECVSCSSHLGWKFDATEKKLVPQKFFAVLKNKISWSMKTSEDVRSVVHPHS